jgi:endonuclease/exonuclease/phosphatase family metal-dependent hydrolase
MSAVHSGAVTRLTVASYNVHGCVGGDGQRDVARVARVLRDLGADVIALQEVDCYPEDPARPEEPIEVLAHLSGYRAVWAPTLCTERGHFGNAILTSLPVVSRRIIDLSYKGYEPRSALDVELDHRGDRLRVIATHLGLWPSERRFQVQKLVTFAEHAPDLPTVLLGDINEWLIRGRPLRWLHAHFGHSPHVRSFPARLPVFALDRIWAHPPRLLSGLRAHRAGEARVASDHLPVLGDVDLPRGEFDK